MPECVRGSHPPCSLPSIDFSSSHRPAKQSPRAADGCFQGGCIKRARGVGRHLQTCDDLFVQTAMIFLGAFFEFPVQVGWDVLQRDRRHFATIMVPFWLSTRARRLSTWRDQRFLSQHVQTVCNAVALRAVTRVPPCGTRVRFANRADLNRGCLSSAVALAKPELVE
jgi:hypothetical protein